MAGASHRSFDSADETRSPDRTTVEIIKLEGATAARMTFEPGWRWSECIQPIVGTESCQARHVGVMVEGQLHVRHDDGTEIDVSAGEAYVIEPGHDAWVVGDATAVGYEFEGTTAASYARGN